MTAHSGSMCRRLSAHVNIDLAPAGKVAAAQVACMRAEQVDAMRAPNQEPALQGEAPAVNPPLPVASVSAHLASQQPGQPDSGVPAATSASAQLPPDAGPVFKAEAGAGDAMEVVTGEEPAPLPDLGRGGRPAGQAGAG